MSKSAQPRTNAEPMIMARAREEFTSRYAEKPRLRRQHLKDLDERFAEVFKEAGLDNVHDFADRETRMRLKQAILKRCPGSFAGTAEVLSMRLDSIGKCLKIAADSLDHESRVKTHLLNGRGSMWSDWKAEVQHNSGFFIEEVAPMSEDDLLMILQFLAKVKKYPKIFFARPDEIMRRLNDSGELKVGDWKGLRSYLRKNTNKWPSPPKSIDRMILWCYIRIFCARRFNEINALTRGDIELSRGIINFVTSKKRGYPVKTPLPITKDITKLLKSYLRKYVDPSPSARLFPNNESSMCKAQKSVLFLAGVTDWNVAENSSRNPWHRLRSTFTQILQKSGLDPMLAADVFGITRRTLEKHYLSPVAKAGNRQLAIDAVEGCLMQKINDNTEKINELQESVDSLMHIVRTEEKIISGEIELPSRISINLSSEIAPGTVHSCTYKIEDGDVTATTPFSLLLNETGNIVHPDSSSNLDGPTSSIRCLRTSVFVGRRII
jgi:integrase